MVDLSNIPPAPSLPCPICWSSAAVESYAVQIYDPHTISNSTEGCSSEGGLESVEGYWCKSCDLIFDMDDVYQAGLLDDDGSVRVDLARFTVPHRGSLVKQSAGRGATHTQEPEIPTFGRLEKINDGSEK